MATSADNLERPQDRLSTRFSAVRGQSVALCATLKPEDTVVQSMPDVSPTKWHLAHTSWFFETFVLGAYAPNYTRFDTRYDYLFNSYYYTAGSMHARPKRGLLSRPTWNEVLSYREHVNDAVLDLLEKSHEPDVFFRIELGLQHERQHQELLLTDIKHVLSCNPLQPAMNPGLSSPPAAEPAALEFESKDGGIVRIGAEGAGFCFDNETPEHDALLHPHAIANRLVTNEEFLAFIEDGGYANSEFWLSDGWAAVNERGWQRPLYWNEDNSAEFTLGGMRDLDPAAPVCHVSYYEADAFARWCGARLPTEFEWEHHARDLPVRGNLLEENLWHPAASDGAQFFGDVWEWTSSAYGPYPGFKPLAGSLGEYNGKFMCSQMSVRGGSCVSAADHLRASYRSFFYPDARWQFLGIRLAKDLHSK